MQYFIYLTLFLLVNNLIEENIWLSKFNDFKKNYNKNYANEEEEQKRYNTYKKNLEKYGHETPFSDVPDREQAIEELKNIKELPDQLRYDYLFGDAKNQKNCGFCYVFGFLAHLEAQYSIKYQKTYKFSEQELLDCSNYKLTCNGGTDDDIRSFLSGRNYLALDNGTYPTYTGTKTQSNCGFWNNKNNKYTNSKKIKINEIKYHLKDSNDNKKKMKNGKKCIQSLLLRHGPLSASVIDEVFDGYQKDDIIKNEPLNKCSSSKETDHTVTIVGYDYYTENNKKIHYWIIRNSKGTKFGNNGYGKIKAGDNICKIESSIREIDVGWDSWCSEGCNECKYENNKLSCKSCISGYRYNSIKCDKCKTEHCSTCTNSISTCEKCEDGYYLFGTNTCYKCHPNCKTCKGPGQNDCYIQAEESETFIDGEINENCFCCGKYLVIYISLIILFLLF